MPRPRLPKWPKRRGKGASKRPFEDDELNGDDEMQHPPSEMEGERTLADSIGNESRPGGRLGPARAENPLAVPPVTAAVFFQEIGAALADVASRMAQALGFKTSVQPEAHTVVIIEPDPPDTLPWYGNMPRDGRKQPHSCAGVETYFNVRSKRFLTTRIKERSKPRRFEFIGADIIRVRTEAGQRRRGPARLTQDVPRRAGLNEHV